MSTNFPGNDSRRWALLGGVLLFTFLVLGFFGREVYRQAPPIPERVVTRPKSASTWRIASSWRFRATRAL